jgi:hypothetical protein
MITLLLLACFSGQPQKPADKNGWREIASPRTDLQCWVRWDRPDTVVCVPALNSTHGASL